MLTVNICHFIRIRKVSHLQCCVIVHKIQVEFVLAWGLFKLLNKSIVHNLSNLQATKLLSNTAYLSSHHQNTKMDIYTYNITAKLQTQTYFLDPCGCYRYLTSPSCPATLFSTVHLLFVSASANSHASLLQSLSANLIILWPTMSPVFTVEPCF